ncbi:MAG: adenosylcobinamide-GDP ribazoletransferase [Fusobacterium sp.]|nr:adenosylcobinamide-GDP ribazoletransferase [Fusobacterium sp.]
MKGFLLLMSFMTRLYVPKVEYNEERLGKSMKFFPLVGFIIGLILVLITLIANVLTGSILVSILLMIIAEVVITGGIHLDGLADTFDGIFSYRSKQKMLEIMKDSRVGTNGALALIIYFMLKFFLIYEISHNSTVLNLLYLILTFPVIARLSSVVSCASAPYARASGMGKAFVDNTKFKEVLSSFLLTIYLLLFSIFLLKGRFIHDLITNTTLFYIVNFLVLLIIFPIMIMLVSFLISKLMIRKIGGITGDTLGAVLKLSEILYLLLYLISTNLIGNYLCW